MNYKYLFPYEKIPYGSSIIIYGAGDLGQDYLRQMGITNYCKVVAIVDKNYSKYPHMVVPVISPDRIKDYEADYVVIALRMQAGYLEVLRVIRSQGIDDDRIICIFERDTSRVSILSNEGESENGQSKEYDITEQSIAILATGGFGDMVIQKRFIMELIKYAPDSRFIFYNIKAIDFLKHLYSDIKNVDMVMDDLGFRYQTNRCRYNLAMTIEACHFIRVDEWNEKKASQVFPEEFVRRISILKAHSDDENIGINTPAFLTMTRRRFKGLNAYSGFNYDGAFEIGDKKVSIPLDESFKDKFNNLSLGTYITFNYGNGDSERAEGIAKSWDKASFESVIKAIKNQFRDIQIIQLGGKNALKLENVDKYYFGEDFRLVLHIIKNSILHVDIEGGLVHFATQLGTKCVVLFGPTVPDYYGYDQNINIRAGNCRECWGLYSNVNQCARGMDEPECMKQITPDMVIREVTKYLDELGSDRKK